MSFLAEFPSGDVEVELLKRWLKGHITTPDFLATNIRKPQTYRVGLQIASREIIELLDPQLEAVIRSAAKPDAGIELDENDFFNLRIVDFEAFVGHHGGARLGALDEPNLVAFLEAARDEIEWLTHEIRRLELHTDNARDAIRNQTRKSFTYAPCRRKHDLAAAAAAPRDADADAHAPPPPDEDEEMLDHLLDAREPAGSASPAPLGQTTRATRAATPEPRRGGPVQVRVTVEEVDEMDEHDRRDSGGGGEGGGASSGASHCCM